MNVAIAIFRTDSRELPRRGRWQAVVETLVRWRRRSRERQELMQLSEVELHDFGAGKSEAFAEASKPFWRA